MVGGAMPSALRAAEELEAADLAEPDVDDHRVDDALVQCAQRGGDVVRGDHVHAFLAQRDLDRLANVLLVVEHQDYRHGSTRTNAGWPSLLFVANVATMLEHYLLHDGEPQAHVVLASLGRDVRIEHAADDLG